MSVTRALCCADASHYRQIPIEMVVARSVEDVVAEVELCAEHGTPILAGSAETAYAGQSVNTAVVLDCSRHLKLTRVPRGGSDTFSSSR